jgi:hypothetical protein
VTRIPIATLLLPVARPNVPTVMRLVHPCPVTRQLLSLRKSINQVNITNIKQVVFELCSEDLVRERSLFARNTMKAQASWQFTPIFAALVVVINSKSP